MNQIEDKAGNTQINQEARRDIELDFIRGIAILLALGWHFNEQSSGFWILDLLQTPGRTIGWAGVDLFFVLSGFLVGGLVFKEFRKTGGFKPARFLARRALKIWPILYLYLILLLISGRYDWKDFFFQNALHVQNYLETPLLHLWSLAVEEHFYLALCFLIALNTRVKDRMPNAGLIVISAIPILCITARFWAFSEGMGPTKIQWQTQFRIDSLACGVFLAYLSQFREQAFKSLLRQRVAMTVIVLCGTIALAYFADDEFFKATFGYTTAYLSAAAFLILCIGNPLLTSRPAPARAVAFLGKYSYAMYIYQFVGYRLAEAIQKAIQIHELPYPLELGVKYAGAITIAIAITKLVEQPFIRLRDRLFPSNSTSNGPSGIQNT